MIAEDMVKTMVSELEKLITTERVIGKPQTFGDITVIPVCSIGFGFGAGGGKGINNEIKGYCQGDPE